MEAKALVNRHRLRELDAYCPGSADDRICFFVVTRPRKSEPSRECYRRANSEERNEVTLTENTENGDATKPSGPIEVWIRQKRATTFTCMVVYDDESTFQFDLVSRTLAAAQREVAGRLMSGGYQPAGRWRTVELRRHSSQENCGAASLCPDVVSLTLRGNGPLDPDECRCAVGRFDEHDGDLVVGW